MAGPLAPAARPALKKRAGPEKNHASLGEETTLRTWIFVAAATTALAYAFTALGLPSATLFAALLVGVVVSVRPFRSRWPDHPPVKLPSLANRLAQACIGVLIGALVQPSAIGALASDWLIVLAATLATLVISVLGGILLGLHRDLDPITGSFSLVAGGASGLTAISSELGADQRVVAVVQYLRVLIIVVAMPAVASALPAGHHGPAQLPTQHGSLLFTAVCVTAGLLLARYLPKIPAVSLLGPMVLAAVLTATGLSAHATVPGPVEQVAYALIGLQVGLSFTRESLKAVRRVLPLAITLVVALIVATAAVGIPLLSLAGASPLDGYLATTPGGLYAVLATATSTGADTTLILTVQVLRLLVMLLLAPAVAALLSRSKRLHPTDTDN
ncbi:AbrB family transcriptional regulator [Cryptosporangium phraense]|uniref:AbrB family transcriptional regulator n=1 Tax=Cryptosporangium phraense TaxID=2593070 RepID=A0A545AI25_9ACTN|nr:AbrB family transcriptional regulator [Cryptosporangium phraense]TQS40971.1 AbrB family transcriptional regulator [Cryptosporangium phraense]